MNTMDEANMTLDNYWKNRAGYDEKMAITFITYFKSKGVLFKAFDELSFAEVDGESINCPTVFQSNRL